MPIAPKEVFQEFLKSLKQINLNMKKNCKQLHLCSVMIFCFISLNSQQSILLNQAAYNAFILNPAAIGLKSEVTANCHYKKNWMGLSESPELMQFTIDGPINKGKIG